jgi:hypothetical protein
MVQSAAGAAPATSTGGAPVGGKRIDATALPPAAAWSPTCAVVTHGNNSTAMHAVICIPKRGWRRKFPLDNNRI